MKCTDLLTRDHTIIVRALDVLDQMAVLVANNQTVDPQDVETLLRFLRTFADNHHQTKEESALFPELMRTIAGSHTPLQHMIFEHDQERSLVEGLEDALYTKKGKEFVHFANRLSSLIRTHMEKEDNLLFQIVNRSLSREQDERVTAELNQFQVDLGVLADLRRLEWVYLKRVA
jgi:hemerythrin-like domain-containing protein